MSTALPFVLPFIRWANVAVQKTHWSVSHRRLYDHEFVYVLSGRGHIAIEGKAYRATPDRLFLILPRVLHSFEPDESTPLHLLGVHFDWTPQHDTLAFPIYEPAAEPVDEKRFRAPRQVPGWDLKTQPFLDLQGRPAVRDALEAVVSEYNRYDEEARDGAGALLAAAILEISRTVRSLQQEKSSTQLGADALRRLQRARDLLEANPESPLSVEEVAQRVGWSGDHLRRVFRQALGQSPSEIQSKARLQLARDLLRYGDKAIAEVAERCGFDDPSHFARAFKAFTGLTPRQYSRLARRA
jgi:AraC-like DNA-binding protein